MDRPERIPERRRIDDLIPLAPPGPVPSLLLTLVCTAAAALLRWSIDPLVGEDMALVTFLVPAAVMSFVLGHRWGALAVALGGAAGLFLFAPASGGRPSTADLWALGAYAMVAAAIVGILGLARSALLSARAEKARAEAASETLQLVSQELSHRIQNIFAVVAGIVRLSIREHPEARRYADDLLSRIQALGSAHELVRPHSPRSRTESRPTSLGALLESLFEAYREGGAERIVISGDEIALKVDAATPVALLFHELATNALKYGALSRPEGRVSLATRDEGESIHIVWSETGGPTVREIPVHAGFGGRLITMSVEKQLFGTIQQYWSPLGLQITLTIPRSSLTD